ncbi:unnamed protein product [Durusdinium trenchii]|uniref:PABC domain-containing protein n=2 Tax=Durusdinium trenchii TaxID=1381693 RepID=A0ABP0SD28_9DINO
MGLRKKEADVKHRVHEHYYSHAKESADIHIIENVTEYQLQDYVDLHFGNVGWDSRIVKLDPRCFGYGCARPRIYGIIWNVAYMGQWNPDFPFLEVLSALQEANLKDYCTDFPRNGWKVCDLNQMVRNSRGRTECKDGSLMTLTTNSGSLFSKASRRVMDPVELFTTHALPLTSDQSEAAGAPPLGVASASKTASVRMAGNAMSLPCVGAIIVAAILGLS